MSGLEVALWLGMIVLVFAVGFVCGKGHERMRASDDLSFDLFGHHRRR